MKRSEIKNILIAGGGMMGKNIAFVFSSEPSFRVTVYDIRETDVAGGIRLNCAQLLEKGVLSPAELEERLGRISFTTDLDSEAVKAADLVVEAVFEDMGVKRETFEETGLILNSVHFYGIIHFRNDKYEDEEMYLYSSDDFSGELSENCVEGELRWVAKEEIFAHLKL